MSSNQTWFIFSHSNRKWSVTERVSAGLFQQEEESDTNPFHSFQVSFQQTVQRECDDVVHVLQLQTGSCVTAQMRKTHHTFYI